MHHARCTCVTVPTHTWRACVCVYRRCARHHRIRRRLLHKSTRQGKLACANAYAGAALHRVCPIATHVPRPSLLLLFAVTPTAIQATFPVERACTPNIASCGCACCLGTKVTVFSKASESGCDIGALCTSKADATAVTDLETTVTNTNERVLALEIKQAEADEARVKAVGGVFCASSGMAVALRCVCMQCEHVSSSSQQLKLTLWYVCVCACACVRAYVYARACVPVYGMVCA